MRAMTRGAGDVGAPGGGQTCLCAPRARLRAPSRGVPRVLVGMAAAPAAAAAAPAQGQQGAPAANSVAAFLARWEQMAKLSDAQYGRITTLSKLTAERPVPKDFARIEDTPAPAAPSDLGLDGIDKIDNIQQFYEWFASLEQEIAEEKEEKFTCVSMTSLHTVSTSRPLIC